MPEHQSRWEPPAPLTDALRDGYVLTRELGRVGMATVYLARDLRHDRPVALKVLHPELARSVGADRFLREIRTAWRLQHPHSLSVHDSGEAAGRLWFTPARSGARDTAETFTWLERGVEARDAVLNYGFASQPLFEPFHRHPRGAAIFRKMGLPANR